jgi:hypothetical protein
MFFLTLWLAWVGSGAMARLLLKVCPDSIRKRGVCHMFQIHYNCLLSLLGIFFQIILDNPFRAMVTLSSITFPKTHHTLWVCVGSSHWLRNALLTVRSAGGTYEHD